MKDEKRIARQREIEAAAYELLAAKGYAGTSMLSIARRARCSNETLYSWYGDKLGLIHAMVTRNAAGAKELLTEALRKGRSPYETLAAFGPALLKILLDERAIALNRAAAADSTGELGAALSAAGREMILPLLEELLRRAAEDGSLRGVDRVDACDLYLSLLIGDLQIRRVIGRLPEPSQQQIAARAAKALRAFITLTSAEMAEPEADRSAKGE